MSSVIVERIDWDRVLAAISDLGPSPRRTLASFDRDDALDLVKIAVEKWGEFDLGSLSSPRFEVSFREEFTNGCYATGVLDIFAERASRRADSARENVVIDRENVVIDWKTRLTADVDRDWERRLAESWQWRIYLRFSGASTFVYRGIARRTGRTRAFEITAPPDNAERVDRYLLGVSRQIQALQVSALPVWPQAMPQSCFAFGRDCEYRWQCRAGSEPAEPLIGARSLSYTAAELFMLCPERYRRDALALDESNETDGTMFGSAFHRGIAAAYGQLFREEG